MQNVVHLVVLLAALFAVAAAGRVVARLLRLPSVIGEIALSILLGPVLLQAFGRDVFTVVLPTDIVGSLKKIGEAGLVLFLAGIVHQLDHGTNGLRGRTVGRITVGAFVLPLLTGLVFAAWVLFLAPSDVRGTAGWPALVVMLAVAMSVTAVPVLARIIEERRGVLGRSADLSMMASMLIDTPAWLLLAIALGLSAGGVSGVWIAFATIAVGAVIAFWCYRLLDRVTGVAASYPRIVALVLGAVALAAGNGVHAFGLTSIFGAFLVGMMIPKGPAWERVVGMISRVGRVFVPVFFVVAGLTLATGGIGALPWFGVVLAVVLGIAGKVGGGYLGARWGGADRVTSLRVGVLVNTRGLTEIVVLQAGFTAGLLTPGLFVALLVMALVTTTMTGPLIDLIERRRGGGGDPVTPSFRSLMAGFPTGVAVLTTFDADDAPWGMTISSVCSVSMDPPTLLVCVRNGSPTLDALLHKGSFTVNLLHHAARPVAELFSSAAPDRFSRVSWERPALGGPHLVQDAHAMADCEVTSTQHVGTHIVVFGTVQHVTHRSREHPLLYGMRQYAAWPASVV